MVKEYRERIYIRKDILMKLYEYGTLNQSKLLSFCGLNAVRHKGILDGMEKSGLIERVEEQWGSKTVVNYRASEKGRHILTQLFDPYEELFPRGEENETDK